MQRGGDRYGLLMLRELSCWPARENRFHLTIRCRLQSGTVESCELSVRNASPVSRWNFRKMLYKTMVC